MANVSFLRGTQNKLDTLLKNSNSKYTEGAFYLTTDSDRLYFAQSADKLVHLNHNVIQVDNVAALPAVEKAIEGDFYYAKFENVLCTKVGSSWIQINKNSNDDTYVAGIDDMKVESTAEGGITISFDIKQNKKDVKGDEQASTDIPVSFTISRSDLATANNIDVGVATSKVTNGVNIATVGDGSSGAGFNLTATGNAKLTRDNTGNVNITAIDTTYDLGASNNQITLSNNQNTDIDFIDVSSGNDVITVVAANDDLTITHKAYDTTHTTSSIEPAAATTFTAIDSLTFDKGHITGYNTKTIPNIVNKSADISADNQGKLTVSITDNKDDIVSKTSGQVLYFTVGDGDNKKTVYNQGDLDVYTKGEIDGKIEAVNAMAYKGIVASNLETETNTAKKALPTDNVSVGDTWKVAHADRYGGYECHIGDLLIATGPETNGVINKDDIIWTYIPSGDDTDSQYELNVADNTISLKNTVTKDVVGSATVKGSTYIGVATNGTDITISHKDGYLTKEKAQSTAATAAPTYGESFTVVDSITTDNGHVSAFNTKTVTLPAAIVSTLSAANNQIVLNESSGDTNTIDLVDDNAYITVTAADNKITTTHKTYDTLTATTLEDLLTLNTDKTFDIITSISRDSGGHLSDYTVQSAKLPFIDTVTTSVANVGSNKHKASFTTTITETTEDSYASTVTLASSSLQVEKDATATNTINIDLVWGLF